jgi:hypothetical protein
MREKKKALLLVAASDPRRLQLLPGIEETVPPFGKSVVFDKLRREVESHSTSVGGHAFIHFQVSALRRVCRAECE